MKYIIVARTLLTLLPVLTVVPGIPSQTRLFEQDLTLYQSTTGTGMGMGTEGKGPQTSVSYFSNASMKTTSANGNDVIMRYDQGKIISIDHKKKTYSEMTGKSCSKRSTKPRNR